MQPSPHNEHLIDLWVELGRIPHDLDTVAHALDVIVQLRAERDSWRTRAVHPGRPTPGCRHTWSEVDHDLVECTSCGWTTQPHIAATFDMHHAPVVEVTA